jgi:formylglycine-generating enzyme required for sulfatase activity
MWFRASCSMILNRSALPLLIAALLIVVAASMACEPQSQPQVVDDRFPPAERVLEGRKSAQGAAAGSAAEPNSLRPVGSAQPLAAQAAKRLPIPGVAQLAKSREVLREVYGRELEEAKTESQKAALATKLLGVAAETKNGSDAWALLQAAQKLAASAFDAPLLSQICDQMGSRFEFDSLNEEADTLLAFDENRSTAEKKAATARRLLDLMGVALRGDDFDRVLQLADVASRFATRSGDTELAGEAQQMLLALITVQPLFIEAQAAREELAEDGRHPGASAAQGRFLCFVLGDWEAGLPLLAQSDDRRLAQLAQRETADTHEVSEMAAIGDAWWSYAASLDGFSDEVLAAPVKLHAAAWYQRAVAKLDGLQRAKLEKRIAETEAASKPLFSVVVSSEGGSVAPIGLAKPLPFPCSAERVREGQDDWARLLKLPSYRIRSKVGIELVVVPPGEFLMGTPESESGRVAHEGPQHKVRLTKPMLVGVYEIKQREYQTVMGHNPSFFGKSGGTGGRRAEDFPVENITWFDACDFCNKLSKTEGLPEYYEVAVQSKPAQNIMAAAVRIRGGSGYRLPTEAEFEYFARAGTTTPFPFGSVHDGTQGNQLGTRPYGTSGPGVALNRATTVGSYQPNALGIYDVDGNVGEWNWDYFDPKYYSSFAGKLAIDPMGPDHGLQRVNRSNAAQYEPVYGRSGRRHGEWPTSVTGWTGLRVLRNPDVP